MAQIARSEIITELTFEGKDKSSLNEYSITNPTDNLSLKSNLIARDSNKEIFSAIKSIVRNEYKRDGGKVIVVKGIENKDVESLIILFSCFIGTPTIYTGEGDLIMDIKAQKGVSSNITSYRSANEMRLHSDLTYFINIPDALGLYCINPGDIKPIARCRFSSIQKSLKELSYFTVEELKKPIFSFPKAEHTEKANSILKRQPIITKNNRHHLLRIRFDTVECETEEGRRAIKDLESSLEKNAVEFIPEKDSIILFSNRKFVHGRTPFSASYTEKDRHLKRIYINY